MSRALRHRVLALSCGLVLLLTACDKPAAEAPQPRPVRVATVILEPSAPAVRYAAVIRPRIEADLGFRIPGKMIERLVEVGQRVAPGQPLARLDPKDLDLQVKATEAQLASAQADAANARADFHRAAELKRGGWTSGQNYDHARAADDRAKARITELQASLDVLRNSSRYAVLTAGDEGVITAILVEPGQVLAAGQTAFRLARLDEMEVVADVPEQQANSLADHILSVEAWSLPGVTIAATLREISPTADPITRTYRLRATLKAPPPELQLGMTATLIAQPRQSIPVARIPLASLTQQGDQPAVWIVNAAGDGVTLHPVQVLAYSGEWAIIGSGLSGGEKIVTAGVYKLDASQRIRVWRAPS